MGVNPTTIPDDPEQVARESLASLKAPDTVTPADLLASPHALVGVDDTMVEMPEGQRKRYAISSITVCSTAMDAFAPVVARLAGC